MSFDDLIKLFRTRLPSAASDVHRACLSISTLPPMAISLLNGMMDLLPLPAAWFSDWLLHSYCLAANVLDHFCQACTAKLYRTPKLSSAIDFYGHASNPWEKLTVILGRTNTSSPECRHRFHCQLASSTSCFFTSAPAKYSCTTRVPCFNCLCYPSLYIYKFYGTNEGRSYVRRKQGSW